MVMEKVTDPGKMVTDELVLRELACQGIDKDYVEFFQDYAPRGQGKECSPCAKFYRDLKSGRRFMVVSGLPMVTATGDKIEVGWLYSGGKYYSKTNLFSAEVDGKRITVDDVTWQPRLFLDGIEQSGGEAVLLETDPTNEDYHQNVLEWDYGICKRRLRIIEGRIREKWVFSEDPGGEVGIEHNHTGKLNLGQFAINDDEELVTKEYFANPEDGYPVEIGASPETFYSAAADGFVRGDHADWATCRGLATGTVFQDAVEYQIPMTDKVGENPYHIYRAFLMFDTSGLPDTCNITAAVLSIYGRVDKQTEDNAGYADLAVFEGTQGDSITTADFDAFNATMLTDGTYSWANPLNTDDYNDATLNSDGWAVISKTGTTYFCTRLYSDYDNHAPTGYNRSDYWANEKGAGYYPKLIVTYSTVTEKSSSDAGSGTESLGSRLLGAAETGSALEEALLTAVLTSGDEGLGSEFGGLLKEIFAGDDGGGRDVLRALVKIPTTGSDMRLPASPG